jgi:hypothetical protein
MPDEPSISAQGKTPGDRTARKRRIALSIGVVIVVASLQLVSQYIAGFDPARLLNHVLFFAVSMPPLMWIFSLGFAWAMRRRLSALPMIVAGVLVAGVVGAALNFGLRQIAEHVSFLRSHHPLVTPRVLLFGFLSGQFELGLWALAFVLPFAAEDARVRSLEADKLRLEA